MKGKLPQDNDGYKSKVGCRIRKSTKQSHSGSKTGTLHKIEIFETKTIGIDIELTGFTRHFLTMAQQQLFKTMIHFLQTKTTLERETRTEIKSSESEMREMLKKNQT